jgi:hypothetical protein
MCNNNQKQDNYHPQDYGYQPKSQPVNEGYSPPKQATQPVPPPKKP